MNEVEITKPFINHDFLLENKCGIDLYERYAAPLPILDYHNHLSPKEVAENRTFNNLTEIWLEGDHYKWRAMRLNGINEKYCTGNAPPQEKFMQWASTMPHTLLNPLYHWSHLELKNYFGVADVLNEQTASKIYERCSADLQREDFRSQSLLKRMNVEVICTTDDPSDDLSYHQSFANQHAGFKMYPTFRPDKVYATEDPVAYRTYLEKLSSVVKISINTFDDLLEALKRRIDFFDSLGCRASDHGLEHLYFDSESFLKAPIHFKKIRSGVSLNPTERSQLRCAVLVELCKLYHAKQWSQQFHLGALRNNNSRLRKKLGADSGFDSIGDFPQAQGMSLFFDHVDKTDQLAQTIIYNLNPADNETFAAMVGNFSDGTVAGKMQWGPAWWFNDQKEGMEKQLVTLSNLNLLSRFVGMTTDSRSFLSFSRHEYFRRILCNLLGKEMEKGNVPTDLALVGSLVERVCYSNAKNYFKFQ
jgi:glucuronate isomerase